MTLKRVLGSLLGVLLLVAALWVLRRQLAEHSLGEVMQELRSISPLRLGLSLLATLLSYLALSAQDLLALRALGVALPARKAALAGFAGFAFANSLPFAVVAGGAVRARFYAGSRLSTGTTTRLVLFNAATYALGLLAAGGLAFTFEPRAVPGLLKLPVDSTRPLGIGFLGLLGLFMLWSVLGGPALRLGKHRLRPTPPPMSLARLGVSAADWLFSGAALFVLLPGSDAFGFPGFLGVFMLGQIAGLVAQLPGGIGVFEAIVVGMLRGSMAVPAIFSALLIYRAIYFLLPLLVAAAILAVWELHRPEKKKSRK